MLISEHFQHVINMNPDTGTIHLYEKEEHVPYKFIRLGNLPKDDCQKCKGTVVKRITAQGKRTPCECTNPR